MANFLSTPTDMLTTGTNPLALVEGALKAYREVNTVVDFYNKIFEIKETERAFEIIQMGIPSGMSKFKAEGAAIKPNSVGVAWNSQFQLKNYGSSLSVSAEMLMFNTIEKQWPQLEANLKKSILLTRNILATSVLEKGFTVVDGASTFLGQPLFSEEHQLVNGTMSNKLPNMALSTQSVALMQQQMSQCKDMAGNPDPMSPTALIVSPMQQRAAFRIIGSYYDPESANLGVNFSGPANLGSNFPVIVNPYSDNQGAFYMTTNLITPGLLAYFYPGGNKVEYKNSPDTQTSTMYTSNFMCFGVHDYRAIYGAEIPGGL